MFKWFANESKKEESPPSTASFFNNTFIAFMTTGSWFIYLLALILIGVSVYFFHIDQLRRKALIQRRREIRRANEKPPQKRRPGAATRNHEIFRNVLGKVYQYIEPMGYGNYVLRYAENGIIYGQPDEKEKWEKNTVMPNVVEKLLDDISDVIPPEYPPGT